MVILKGLFKNLSRSKSAHQAIRKILAIAARKFKYEMYGTTLSHVVATRLEGNNDDCHSQDAIKSRDVELVTCRSYLYSLRIPSKTGKGKYLQSLGWWPVDMEKIIWVHKLCL